MDNKQRNVEVLSEIFNHSPSFMTLTVGANHVFELANKRYYEVLRLTPAILGKSVKEIFPELDAQGFISKLDDAFRSGEAFRADEAPLRLRTPEGRERLLYVDFVYQPVRDANGQIFGLVHQGSDVTEKVLARRAIENERENFRNLFRQTPELVCILRGPEHVFEFVNEAHIRTLGFDATGMGVREAQPESVEVHGILDDVYRTGKTAELHEIPVTVSNRRRFFNLTYAARWDEAGDISGILILGVEITDQVMAREKLLLSEERLKASTQNLESAVKARDEFLSVASHELRTPLTTLKLQHQGFKKSIQQGRSDAFSPERIERFVDQSERQTTRLIRLVEDMLDVARIQSGNLAVNREPASLASLAKEVVGRLDPVMRAAGTAVELVCADPVDGNFDSFRMEQVLTNLLTNAMHYGERRPVRVEVKRRDDVAVVQVQDNGLGIEQAAQKRIFNRFERSVSPNEVSGLGLGLFISRQIVEAHRGRIWVESKGVGQGSTFFVELPLGNSDNVGQDLSNAAP